MQRSRDSDDIIERLEHRQEQQRYYHDRSCKPLPNLLPGQTVRIQDPVSSHWKPAVIKKKLDEVPRSYIVTNASGRDLRRNRNHIMEAPFLPREESSQVTTNVESKSAENNERSNHQTFTRSGRLVKPPQRYGFT